MSESETQSVDNNKLRVVFFPREDINNPYLSLLHDSLGKFNIRREMSNSNELSFNWLLSQRHKVNVLHFHWIDYHYNCFTFKGESWFASSKALLKFFIKIILAMCMGYKLVWTMHNYLPHETTYFILDYTARIMMAHTATSIITHSHYATELLAHKFKRKKRVFTVHHPHYIDVYPNVMPKDEARRSLNISDSKRVILYFGLIRTYKGIENLLKVFRENSDPNLVLIVAGRTFDADIERRILEIAKGDERILFFLRHIPVQDVQIYMNAADIVILPFLNATSSGSLMLALSFGKPIIAPATGCISEIITPHVGLLYNPSESDGIALTLKMIERLDLKKMSQNAYKLAKTFTWEEVAKETSMAYKA